MKLIGINMSYRLAMISLDWIRNKDPKVSLGHASILARLFEEQKVLCEEKTPILIDRYEYDVKSSFGNELLFGDFCFQVAKQALSNNPDMISIGAFIWNEIHIQRILKLLRNDFKFKNKIVLGGPQISYALPSTLEAFYTDANFFVRGYAENSFTMLVRSQAIAKQKMMYFNFFVIILLTFKINLLK